MEERIATPGKLARNDSGRREAVAPTVPLCHSERAERDEESVLLKEKLCNCSILGMRILRLRRFAASLRMTR